MGTRSTTTVIENGVAICTMYGQYDGYVMGGHGEFLSNFLNSKKTANGIFYDNLDVANGAGCLAAQMVAFFKKEPGGYYLAAPSADHNEDYGYNIIVQKDLSIVVEVYRWGAIIFSGSAERFKQWVIDS